MSPALLLAFAGFAFVSSITPGPNNTMLLASGVNFGFRRTMPHIAGINLGCAAMLLLAGLGLGQIFTAIPPLYGVLRYAGAAYLLWLAWRIADAGPITPRPPEPGQPNPGQTRRRPMTFLQAAAFQWVNPKAWIMVVGAVTTYAPHGDGAPASFARAVAAMALLLALVNLPSVCIWAGFGTALRPFLAQPRRTRIFNGTMALLLVLSVLPLLAA